MIIAVKTRKNDLIPGKYGIKRHEPEKKSKNEGQEQKEICQFIDIFDRSLIYWILLKFSSSFCLLTHAIKT